MEIYTHTHTSTLAQKQPTNIAHNNNNTLILKYSKANGLSWPQQNHSINAMAQGSAWQAQRVMSRGGFLRPYYTRTHAYTYIYHIYTCICICSEGVARCCLHRVCYSFCACFCFHTLPFFVVVALATFYYHRCYCFHFYVEAVLQIFTFTGAMLINFVLLRLPATIATPVATTT